VNITLKKKNRDFNVIKKVKYHKYIYFSHSPKETISLGEKLGNLLKEGDLVALNGELGTGKTCLIRGIAKGLKSPNTVLSPSFSIINEYKYSGTKPIYHFDLYRINKAEELEGLGYEEYFYGDGITLIEWANKIECFLPEELLLVNIIVDGANYFTRKIIFEPIGDRYQKIIEELKIVENIRY
jgi:tRNA threonylcarbamoyladenosine biosynthesis protein TsaE